MKIGIIGLGRMGMHMALRLNKKHKVIAYNRSPEKIKKIMKKGVSGAFTLKEFVEKLDSPRIVWFMVPAGDPVDKVITGLLPYLGEGDILIDGGNSNYKDSMRRAEYLKAEDIFFLDVGTSGGLGGEKYGYCFMVGGEKKIFDKLKPVFKALAAPQGFEYMGSSGSGHYVKMIHNGIEYALLQSYGEGFELLNNGPFNLDLGKISKVWQHGSVIRSWLLELMEHALKKDPGLEGIKDYVSGGSTGKWTVEESMQLETPAPMISLALALRYRTRQKQSFAGKTVAALRNEFGGHKTRN